MFQNIPELFFPMFPYAYLPLKCISSENSITVSMTYISAGKGVAGVVDVCMHEL